MVARPSLKRVVPGSVPPWRALCAESAPALTAFFSVLCVSKTVLLLESKFVQILRALNSGPCACAWAAGAAGFLALAVARPRVVLGWIPPARACFSWPRRCSGLPQRFSWPRRGFPLPAIKKARSSSLRLIRSLSTFAVETLSAQNFQPADRAATQLNANLKSSPSRWGCFTKHFSAFPGPLRTETCSYSLPLQRICLVRCSPIFAVRHLLRRSRCARALSPLCFRCVRFVKLRWLVWKLTLGSGPGWVGLRSKLLIDIAMKISMSQIL